MEEKEGKIMEKSSIARNTGGGGSEPQGRQGKPAIDIENNLTCHPELDSGSSPRKIIPSPENINNITSASRTAKRKVKGDYVPRKAAFTLAEVLITLGIIGVVAALTMPTLLQKVESEVIKNQFKKVYSMLSQVYVKAQADLGYKPACAYGVTGITEDCVALRQAVEDNLVVIKTCNGHALRDGCLPKSSYNGLDTVLHSKPDVTDEELEFWERNCKGYNKSEIENNTKTLVLKDGVILMFYGQNASPIFIAVDVNGAKGPNKWGHDLFSFEVRSSSSKPLYITGNAGCMPVEEGGLMSETYIKNLYK